MKSVIPSAKNRAECWSPGKLLRRFLLSWLFLSVLQYASLSEELKTLSDTTGLAQLSLPLTVVMTLFLTLLLSFVSAWQYADMVERWSLFAVFGLYMYLALTASYTLYFFLFCVIVLCILGVYAAFGDKPHEASSEGIVSVTRKEKYLGVVVAAIFAALFVFLVCTMTVYRVLTHCAPTFDFGIFSQMFYYMKETGIPYTTCERGGLLSHNAVHVSPIYYLILPFYMLFPSPITLQVMQALILASAVIPLYLIARRRGIAPLLSALLCGVLLLYPAYAGGCSYDLHENKFLTPLLLWLFYFVDRRKIPFIALFALLVMMVKEDAPVYIAVFALYLIVRTLLLREEDAEGKRWSWRHMRFGVLTGISLFLFAVVYFLLVTTYLDRVGDGVMTYRYSNFMYGDNDSLLTVVFSVIVSPMKALFECADAEKFEFFLQTMAPLLFLPLMTRKYERLILLIPYLLINLMSDYQYQHSVFFQYTYGATAFLLYATVLNLADFPKIKRTAAIAVSLIATVSLFVGIVSPTVNVYKDYYNGTAAYQQSIDAALDSIPEDASVTTTTFFTVQLSERRVLHDLYYGIYYGTQNAQKAGLSAAEARKAAEDMVFGTDYVVLDISDADTLSKFATDAEKKNGLDIVKGKLQEYHYQEINLVNDRILIFQKQAAS